jgi:hypothetical protein
MFLALQAPPARAALVVEDVVEVFDAPDPGGMPTSKLRRGERVSVRREEPGGWVAIVPPPGTFSWIEAEALADMGDGRVHVEADMASVRSGRPGARLPGAVQATVIRGAELRLLDRPPLDLGSGDVRRRWVAVEPAAEEVRYILADGIEYVGTKREPTPGRTAEFTPSRPGRGPAWFRDELASLDSRHRLAVSGPVDHWDLTAIRKGYADLLDRVDDEAARELVASRLRRVDLQREVAAAAAEFQSRLRASRARDDDLGDARRKLDERTAGGRREHAAEGLMQASAETLEGQRLYALFGRDGKLSAYLRIPPTLSTSGLVGARVGVVGSVRYRQGMSVRLIEVRDIDLIDRGP